MRDGASTSTRVFVAVSAGVLLLTLARLATDRQLTVPNYYIGNMQVTGTYSGQDIEGIVRFIRGVTPDEVIWIAVPSGTKTAYTNADITRLPTDVVEVSTSDGGFTVSGSLYTLKRTTGEWHVVDTRRWIR
jgi:hypothetical protein